MILDQKLGKYLVHISKDQVPLQRRQENLQRTRISHRQAFQRVHDLEGLAGGPGRAGHRGRVREKQTRHEHTRVSRAVQREGDCAFFRFSSVLRCTLVHGQVLVLLDIHAHNAHNVRVHAGSAAAEEYGRDTQDGKQTIQYHGL